MRAFLLYISEHAISGRTDRLKEQTIGTEVLGRRPNYNPADDNIVRVRAHELRGRLEKHFATEGVQEPIILRVPRGSYVPEFVSRTEILPETPESALVVQKPADDAPKETSTKRNWLPIAAMLLIAISGSAVVTRYLLLRNTNSSNDSTPSGAIHDLWGQFFDKPNEELKVVYADTSFALWQDLNGENLNLGDYLNRSYLNVKGDKLFNVAMRRVTSLADIAIATRLAVIAGKSDGQMNLEFARDVNADFLHQGNLVLIGSHRSNPWVEVYEPSLNFQLDQDPHSGAPIFRNQSPQSGETPVYAIPAAYDTQKVSERTYASYGVIALMRGCGGRGLTVVLEGLNAQATDAMGDLVTDPQRLDQLLKGIGHTPGTAVAPFEALIRITSLPGAYADPKIEAYRLRAPSACVGG
ncbi:MAG TPA: hypothetical protein VGT08_19205 [Terracidiphilus sp.]|nr:hypothetical protein [Terracidiphilus sp.]